MIFPYIVLFLICNAFAHPPTVFFHAFVDERKEYTVVMDQLHEIHRNFDINKFKIIVVSNDETLIKHARYFGFYHIIHPQEGFNEINTLHYIYNYCENNKNETFPVLYIHNKGGKYPCITSYFTRSIAMEALVKHADLCLSVLDKPYTVCGVRFSPIPYPHFNGNMWWTTSSYITHLVEPKYINLNYTSLTETSSIYGLNRYYSERWILNYYYYYAYDVLPEIENTILYNPIYYLPLDSIEYKISKSPIYDLPLIAEQISGFIDPFYSYKLDTIIQSMLFYSYNIQLYLLQPLQWCISLLEKEESFKKMNLSEYKSIRQVDLDNHFHYCKIRSNFSNAVNINYVDVNKPPVFNYINKTDITIFVYITEVHNTTQVEIQLNMLVDKIKNFKSKVNIFVKASGSIPNGLVSKIKKIKLISENIEVLSSGSGSIYESLSHVRTYCELPSQNNTSIFFYPIMSSIEDSIFNNSMKLINNTVLNFSLCLEYLNNKNESNNYDLCGIQYSLIPFRQYLWNMIWMRCSYVKKLNPPIVYIINSTIFDETRYSINQYSYYRYFLSNPYHKAISLVSYPILQYGRYFADINYSIQPHESPSLLEIQIDSIISIENNFTAPNVYSLFESLIDLHVLNNAKKLIPYLTKEMRNLTFNDLVNKTRYLGSTVDYYRFMNSIL